MRLISRAHQNRQTCSRDDKTVIQAMSGSKGRGQFDEEGQGCAGYESTYLSVSGFQGDAVEARFPRLA